MYTQLCHDTVAHIVHISRVKVHDGQTDVIVHYCRASCAVLVEEKQLTEHKCATIVHTLLTCSACNSTFSH